MPQVRPRIHAIVAVLRLAVMVAGAAGGASITATGAALGSPLPSLAS
jgi:hypothetical protein